MKKYSFILVGFILTLIPILMNLPLKTENTEITSYPKISKTTGKNVIVHFINSRNRKEIQKSIVVKDFNLDEYKVPESIDQFKVNRHQSIWFFFDSDKKEVVEVFYPYIK